MSKTQFSRETKVANLIKLTSRGYYEPQILVKILATFKSLDFSFPRQFLSLMYWFYSGSYDISSDAYKIHNMTEHIPNLDILISYIIYSHILYYIMLYHILLHYIICCVYCIYLKYKCIFIDKPNLYGISLSKQKIFIK